MGTFSHEEILWVKVPNLKMASSNHKNDFETCFQKVAFGMTVVVEACIPKVSFGMTVVVFEAYIRKVPFKMTVVVFDKCFAKIARMQFHLFTSIRAIFAKQYCTSNPRHPSSRRTFWTMR